MKQLLLFVLFSAVFFAVYGTPEIEGEDGFLEAQDNKRGDVKRNKEKSWQWVRCRYHQQCSAGYYCRSYYCYPYQRCSHHSHCRRYHTWRCDFTDGVCKPGPVECYKNLDCSNGYFCYNYKCYAWYCHQYRCYEWHRHRFCFDGKCMYRECSYDSQCKRGHYCMTPGLCRPRPPTLPPTQQPTTEEPGSGLQADNL